MACAHDNAVRVAGESKFADLPPLAPDAQYVRFDNDIFHYHVPQHGPPAFYFAKLCHDCQISFCEYCNAPA